MVWLLWKVGGVKRDGTYMPYKVVHSVDYIASCQNDNHLKRFKMYVEMYVSVSIAEYPPLLVQRVLICKMSEGRVWEGCAFCRARGC